MGCLCNNLDDLLKTCSCGCDICTTTTVPTTTTTTCIGEPCDEIIDPKCIIYNGPEIPCWGIQTGDSAADILDIIIGLLCTTTTTSPLFSNRIYWGEDIGICDGGIPINVTGDGTTFCNSSNFTGLDIASMGTGGVFFRFADQLKTVNVISGSPIATFNGGCDPC